MSNDKRFCAGFPMTNGVPGKIAMLTGKRWQPGTVLTIRFLSGSRTLQDRVMNAANIWLQFANLQFDVRDSGPTDIRIDFLEGKGSWSFIGTDARLIQPPQPTMNYGWFTEDTEEDEILRVTLHEFGHAIGLIHEHQNPLNAIQWNREVVIRDLSGPPNNWDKTTIENNMFAAIDPADVAGTAVDPASIMMYPIPPSWTLNGVTAGMNSALSDADKEFIRQAYPQ